MRGGLARRTLSSCPRATTTCRRLEMPRSVWTRPSLTMTSATRVQGASRQAVPPGLDGRTRHLRSAAAAAASWPLGRQ
eukprot:209702-Alexandrium_andersonii.AAC.1